MHWLDKAYVKFGALSFLSFEIVSYFDIRISNLVAARGRARCVRLKQNFKTKEKGDIMAEYGEWTRKGATLSDVTAKSEYGVDREFIVKGIEAGKLEYRDGSIWGNPYLRVLRSQLEKFIAGEFGDEYLLKVKAKTELKTVKKEMSTLKKRLEELQAQKTKLEAVLAMDKE